MNFKNFVFKLLGSIICFLMFIAVETSYAVNSCDNFFNKGSRSTQGASAVQLYAEKIKETESRIQENTENFANVFMPKHLKITENIQLEYKYLKEVIEEYLTKLTHAIVKDKDRLQRLDSLKNIEFNPSRKFNYRRGDVVNLYSHEIAKQLLSISKEIIPAALFRVLYKDNMSGIEGNLLMYLNEIKEYQVNHGIFKELSYIYRKLLRDDLILKALRQYYDQALRDEGVESDVQKYNELSKSMDQILHKEGFDVELIRNIDRVRQEFINRGDADFSDFFRKMNTVVTSIDRYHPMWFLRADSLLGVVDHLASVSTVPTEKILADLIFNASFKLKSGNEFFDIYNEYYSLRAKLGYEY